MDGGIEYALPGLAFLEVSIVLCVVHMEASFAETTVPSRFPQGSHCTDSISHVLPIDSV
jgi:hypothetical protein